MPPVSVEDVRCTGLRTFEGAFPKLDLLEHLLSQTRFGFGWRARAQRSTQAPKCEDDPSDSAPQIRLFRIANDPRNLPCVPTYDALAHIARRASPFVERLPAFKKGSSDEPKTDLPTHSRERHLCFRHGRATELLTHLSRPRAQGSRPPSLREDRRNLAKPEVLSID